MPKRRMVYVVGAGLSAGLGFPTIAGLLPQIWDRLDSKGLAASLANVVRFHHPDFNPTNPRTYPDVERLLSEMQANAQLFDSSRPATGGFTSAHLDERRGQLLLQIAQWFHEIQREALSKPPTWLVNLTEAIKRDRAHVISFNWDLVLDELLFGDELKRSSYAFGKPSGPTLIKPHGSLNWYRRELGVHLKADRRFRLYGNKVRKIFAFRPYRAPNSSRREYMPFIIPPVYGKTFEDDISTYLWRKSVAAISEATEVRFLGYSLPDADFHARFILRCGFHNQEHGALTANGKRANPTGRSKVTVVELNDAAHRRIESMVGWRCDFQNMKIEDWVTGGGLHS